MCISIGIGTMLSALSTVVGTGVSIITGMAQAKAAQAQLDIQNQQLKDQQETTRLQAAQVENERLEQDRQRRARNEAMIAASGVSENTSYLQGAEQYNERALRTDVASLRLNSASEINRISQQIAINKANSSWQTTKAWLGAGQTFFQGVGQLGSLIIRTA